MSFVGQEWSWLFSGMFGHQPIKKSFLCNADANAVKKSAKCPKSGYIQYIVKEMKIIKEAKNANFSKVGAVSNAHDVWIFKLGVSSPNI